MGHFPVPIALPESPLAKSEAGQCSALSLPNLYALNFGFRVEGSLQ
jgi:hypothetical protein